MNSLRAEFALYISNVRVYESIATTYTCARHCIVRARSRCLYEFTWPRHKEVLRKPQPAVGYPHPLPVERPLSSVAPRTNPTPRFVHWPKGAREAKAKTTVTHAAS